jgi:prepilin-type N-terminal cleavage/methylation domain-containing protein
MQKSRSGFTIVELLIVIVVIAILATISIVAYNGIQTRAENTKTIAGVKEYVKILANYKTLNGDYPATPSGGRYACLGTGYPDSACHTNNGTQYGIEDATFNAALETITTSFPQLSTKELTLSSTQSAAGGSFLYSAKLIRYHLSGANQECGAGGTGYTYGDVTQCRIVLE